MKAVRSFLLASVVFIALPHAAEADAGPMGLRGVIEAPAPMQLRPTAREASSFGDLPGLLRPSAPPVVAGPQYDLRLSPVRENGVASLDEIFSEARGFSLRLQVDQERQRLTDSQAMAAMFAFFPKVSLGADMTLTSSISYDPDVTQVSNSFPKERSSRIGLEASMPLFDGFRRLNTLRAARTLATAGQFITLETTQQLHLETATAALSVTRDRRRVELQKSAIALRSKALKSLQRLFQDRAVTRTDVALAAAEIEEDRANLELAVAELEASELAFSRLVGRAPPATLHVTVPAGQLPRTAEEAASRAVASSPLGKIADLNAEAAAYQAEATMAGFLPTLDLTATAGFEFDSSPLISRTEEATLMLKLRIPLVDATLFPQLAGARAEARQKRYEAQDLTRDLGIEARTLFVRRDALDRQITALRRQIAYAREVARGMWIEREAETRTILDAFEAEGDILNAELAVAEAEFERDRAGFKLLATSGDLGSTTLAAVVN